MDQLPKPSASPEPPTVAGAVCTPPADAKPTSISTDRRSKEDINIIENDGKGNVFQIMVSTNGSILHGKNKGDGAEDNGDGGTILQTGGSFNEDSTIKQLSKDMVSIGLHKEVNDGRSSQGNIPPVSDDAKEKETASGFKNRHGQGHTMDESASDASSSASAKKIG